MHFFLQWLHSVYTVLSSWPCLFPLFVSLLLLWAPQCCENFNRRPALKCLWAFIKHQLMPWLNGSRKARLILNSLTAFYCFSNDLQSVCLFGEQRLWFNLSNMEYLAVLTPQSQNFFSLTFTNETKLIFPWFGEISRRNTDFAHVFVAHKRPLSCKNVTHFLFHLQAPHDPMKTEGQCVFCALSQHWLMHISHEELYIFLSFSLLFLIKLAMLWDEHTICTDQIRDRILTCVQGPCNRVYGSKDFWSRFLM